MIRLDGEHIDFMLISTLLPLLSIVLIINIRNNSTMQRHQRIVLAE